MSSEMEEEGVLPQKAYLVINSQIFPLKKRVTKIGRRLENDLVLQDPLISRDHAEIEFAENKFLIRDLKSTSGTLVNNKKVSETPLYSGDIILVANIPIMFVNDSMALSGEFEKRTDKLE